MSQSPQRPGFWRNVWGLLPQVTTPKVSVDFQKTMSHLFGWYSQGSDWREMQVDANGRLRTTAGVITSATLAPRTITLPNTETLIFDVNPNRQYVFMDLLGVDYALIAFRAGDIAINACLFWPNDFSLQIEGYTGQIYAQNSNGTGNLQVVEV